MAVLKFTKVKGPQTSVNTEESRLGSDKEVKCEHDDYPEGSNGMEINGFRMLFSVHVHSEPILKIALSTSYDYESIADAVGMVSLIHLKTQAFQLLVCDIAPASDESISVDSMLLSELVQITEIPRSNSSQPSPLTGNSGGDSKTSPLTRPFTRSPGGNTDIPNVVQHREVIPILFIGRGSGKLEMYHVQSATKMGETLVDPQKSNSLSSIIMIDEDGKRIEIPGCKWAERDDLNVERSSEVVGSEVPGAELGKPSEGGTDVAAETLQSSTFQIPDFEQTQQFVQEALHEQSKSSVSGGEPPAEAQGWTRRNILEVSVPPGSLGLHLFMEVEQHAVVKGFAEDNSTGTLIKANGVRSGHVLTSINGVEVSALTRDMVCGVLEKLREREKTLVFAEGFEASGIVPAVVRVDSSDLIINTKSPKDIVRPRFLVCTCGKMIHVVLAAVPSAADMAMGPKEIPAQPLASIELAGPVLVTSVVRVPVGEGVENCLAAIDQSNRVYILSLLSLKLIWEADCNNFGFGLGRSGLVDGVLAEISYGGELIVANSFGEMERFSLFAEHTAMENAMLECKSIKTRVLLAERAIVFDQATSPSSDSGKKRGIAADAGKMFKKLVQRATEETVDLNKVFQFSTEEDERKRLMGDRTAASAKESAAAESDAAKIEHGTNATKDALMQAHQRLAERGEKLSELGLKTEQMKKTSEDFYQTMKAFNEKNANKKWYEF